MYINYPPNHHNIAEIVIGNQMNERFALRESWNTGDANVRAA